VSSINARCLMCGKVYAVSEDHKEYKKMESQGASASFICDLCTNKVRHESDEQKKPKKPM